MKPLRRVAALWGGRVFVCSLFAIRLVGADVAEDSWPRFRGQNGAGVSRTQIPAQWTSAHRLWTQKLPGVGHGSPVVWGGKIFLLCGVESTGERIALCLDAKSGRPLWESKHAIPYQVGHKFNSPASSTPAVDGDHVYFSWGSDEQVSVVAFTHAGQKVWSADLGAMKRSHGFASSPIVQGDLVILSNDQEKDAALFALDRRDGRIRWKLDRTENHSNYSTPCIFTPPGGAPQVIVSSWRLGITGVDLASGRQLWQKSVFAQDKSERAIGSPIATEDLVVANCAFVNGPRHVVAVRVRPGGAVEEAWRLEKNVPHIPSVVLAEGRAVLWSDQGIVSCVRASDGHLLWQERASGDTFSSPVVAGGNVFSIDRKGLVTVLKVADTFEVLARNALEEPTQATPAIAGGRMFVRTWENLHAVGAGL